jgi:hypothetical protein
MRRAADEAAKRRGREVDDVVTARRNTALGA